MPRRAVARGHLVDAHASSVLPVSGHRLQWGGEATDAPRLSSRRGAEKRSGHLEVWRAVRPRTTEVPCTARCAVCMMHRPGRRVVKEHRTPVGVLRVLRHHATGAVHAIVAA